MIPTSRSSPASTKRTTGQDERVWAKANPNLNVSAKLNDLREKPKKAAEMPTALNAFLRLHLGLWTESETRWLPMEKWNACGRTIELESLKGGECWAGLDLASTQDLSALVLAFPMENEEVVVLPYFWAAKLNAAKRERSDRAPYLTWARQEHLTLTEGEVTDYAFILHRIEELAKVYRIKEVAFDRWGAASIVTALQEKNIPVSDFGQGYASMDAPMKEIERLVGSQELVHPQNPVLTWCLSNVVVSMDPAGNVKPNRERSGEKIDGVVAMAMAIGRIRARQKEQEFDIRIF